MNGLLIENLNIHTAGPASDLQTAVTGDYVSLENYDRVLVLCLSGLGTAGDDPTFSFFQAQDVAGTGAKDLNPVSGQTFKKQAATSLASTAQWTDAAAEISANDVAGDGTSAEEELIYAVEFKASDLDSENGFNCLRVDSADVGTNAQCGALIYILGGARYVTDPTDQVTAIA